MRNGATMNRPNRSRRVQPGIWTYRGIRIVESDDPLRGSYRVDLRRRGTGTITYAESMEQAKQAIDYSLGFKPLKTRQAARRIPKPSRSKDLRKPT